MPNPTAAINSYRDLAVWTEAMDLAAEAYILARRLPREERFGLASQMRRSAVSVPSNIAEGWGRGVTREYVQFLRYARGSLKELETQWLLAVRVDYVGSDDIRALDERANRLGKMLLSLTRVLQSRDTDGRHRRQKRTGQQPLPDGNVRPAP